MIAIVYCAACMILSVFFSSDDEADLGRPKQSSARDFITNISVAEK